MAVIRSRMGPGTLGLVVAPSLLPPGGGVPLAEQKQLLSQEAAAIGAVRHCFYIALPWPS